jgi:hypothetical protein
LGKKRKLRSRVKPPTLEEQLAALDREAPPDGASYDVFDGRYSGPSSERIAWAKKRLALVDAIRRRDGKRLADPGRDAGGNFSPSPMATRGHKVETAPKDLGKELQKNSQFPKRIAAQRAIDWYFTRKHITRAEWQAANTLWELWCTSGLEAKVTSGYEPVTTGGSPSQDHKIAKRVDAVVAFAVLMGDAVPYHCRGVVRAVVIEDQSASDWARRRGYSARDSKAHGLDRLRSGLQALSHTLGY